MFTTHGHHIPGTSRGIDQPRRERCGGFEHCEGCLREAAKVYVDSERNHHHILIALTPQNAKEDQARRNLLTNAIAWTFFGKEGEEQVDVTAEQISQSRIAAERCMVALREFDRIRNDTKDRQSGLISHAQRELELIGAEDEVAQAVVAAIRGFLSYGHSGGSASWAIPVLIDLLQFKPLSPLTNDPLEWMLVEDAEGGETWQSVRNPEAFSADGGQHYWLVSDETRKLYVSQVRTDKSSDGEGSGDPQEETRGEAEEAGEEGVVSS